MSDPDYARMYAGLKFNTLPHEDQAHIRQLCRKGLLRLASGIVHTTLAAK